MLVQDPQECPAIPPMRDVPVSRAQEAVASTRAMKAAGCRCNHCAHLWQMSPCRQLMQHVEQLLLHKFIMQLQVSLLSVKVCTASLLSCNPPASGSCPVFCVAVYAAVSWLPWPPTSHHLGRMQASSHYANTCIFVPHAETTVCSWSCCTDILTEDRAFCGRA